MVGNEIKIIINIVIGIGCHIVNHKRQSFVHNDRFQLFTHSFIHSLSNREIFVTNTFNISLAYPIALCDTEKILENAENLSIGYHYCNSID